MKKGGKNIFLFFVVILMLFPFIGTLNELLVRVIEPLIFLKPIQDIIVPYEISLVRTLLKFLSVPTVNQQLGSYMVTLVGKTGGLDPIYVSCIGWQSMVLILASMYSGLNGSYTTKSKIETFTVGILGTFWINIFRLTAIFYLYYHYNSTVAMTFHNYIAILVTIIWLFLFWWYSFNISLKPLKREM